MKPLLKIVKEEKTAQRVGKNKIRVISNLATFNRKQVSRLSIMLGEEVSYLINNAGVLSLD